MLHYNLRNNAQFGGGFTDLFIIGVNRVRAATPPYTISNDFTAAATSQSYNLLALDIGDIALEAALWTKIAFAGTGWSSVKTDVGSTDDADQLVVGTAGDNSTVNFPRGPLQVSASAGGSYSCQAASKYLTALVTNGGAGLMTAVTAGEVWIYARLARLGDHLRDIAA